jgi:ribosome-binding protein aMBF1 (putative translation factor)
MVRMAVQDSIKESRLARQLSQEQLGQALGVNALTVSRWEQGAFLPRRKHWPKIKEVLGVELAVTAEQDANAK